MLIVLCCKATESQPAKLVPCRTVTLTLTKYPSALTTLNNYFRVEVARIIGESCDSFPLIVSRNGWLSPKPQPHIIGDNNNICMINIVKVAMTTAPRSKSPPPPPSPINSQPMKPSTHFQQQQQKQLVTKILNLF